MPRLECSSAANVWVGKHYHDHLSKIMLSRLAHLRCAGRPRVSPSVANLSRSRLTKGMIGDQRQGFCFLSFVVDQPRTAICANASASVKLYRQNFEVLTNDRRVVVVPEQTVSNSLLPVIANDQRVVERCERHDQPSHRCERGAALDAHF